MLFKGLLVEPRTEYWERRWIVSAAFSAYSAVVAPQRIRRQHDGKLEFDRFLHAVRLDLKLGKRKSSTSAVAVYGPIVFQRLHYSLTQSNDYG